MTAVMTLFHSDLTHVIVIKMVNNARSLTSQGTNFRSTYYLFLYLIKIDIINTTFLKLISFEISVPFQLIRKIPNITSGKTTKFQDPNISIQ